MVLFVCHGNVARSQFAEALMRQRGVADVGSAGTSVPDERAGNRLSNDGETASRIADQFRQITGIDISAQTRAMVTPELVERADVIVVMTKEEDLPAYFRDHRAKMELWEIEDPHDMTVDGTRAVLATIEERIDQLTQSLGRQPSRSSVSCRKMMGAKWVYFDLGSTLLDETACVLSRLERAAGLARDYGVDVTADDLWDWAEEAHTAFESSPFRHALLRSGLSPEHQLAVHEGAPYLNSGEVLYPGVPELLRGLASKYRLGIIANQPPGLVPRLAEHGILSPFRQVLGSGDLGHGKPGPEIFRCAMREAPLCLPDQMVMVGDRVDNDIRPARRMGWKTVRVRQGIARGQLPREPAEQPEHEIDSIKQLDDIL